jgi:cardiolipin synthase
MLVFVSALLTLVVVILVLNFKRSDKRLRREVHHLYSVGDPQFLRAMGVLLGPAIVAGNQAETLLNGDQIFPSMLAAIRGARSTITFATYIYWSAPIGMEFAQALAERSRAGVKVHVLVDWAGSQKMDPDAIATMEGAGVELQKYNPLRWYSLGRVNNRTHRKILVVDGEVGFTGGVGIGAVWTGHAQDPDHWRDTHFKISGPVVAQMQAAFLDDWIKATGKVLHGADYFPPLEPTGRQAAQVFLSSPSGGSESMELMYLLAISAAERSILLASAYFVPDDLTLEAFKEALQRGVQVRIITPGEHTDNDLVRGASRARWGELLEGGAEIFEYRPTMYHCKALVVDDYFVSVGSTNFDPRSFGLNNEANLNLFDADFARRQVEIFHADLAQSRQVTFEEWKNRPLREKVKENLASLLGGAL